MYMWYLYSGDRDPPHTLTARFRRSPSVHFNGHFAIFGFLFLLANFNTTAGKQRR
jgi:hypothetical protein